MSSINKGIANLHPWEIEVEISDTGRVGVWANTVNAKGHWKKQSAAARLPAGDATSHTQLCFALCAAFRSISSKRARQLAEANGVPKARVKISTMNPTFAQAVADTMSSNADGVTLRAVSSIARDLYSHIRCFDVTWVNAPEDPSLLALREWSLKVVIDPREITKMPAVFRPVAVSMAG